MNPLEYNDANFDEFSSLGEIFPDLEPYLEEVTNNFEEAKTQCLDFNIDCSDSDSGISADNFKSLIKTNDDIPILDNSSLDCLTDIELNSTRNSNCEIINFIPDVKQESKVRKNVAPIRILKSNGIDFSSNPKTITAYNIKNSDKSFYDDKDGKKICIRNLPSSSNYNIPTNIPKITFDRSNSSNSYDYFKSSSTVSSTSVSAYQSKPSLTSQVYSNHDEVAGIFDAQQVDRLIKKQERMIKNRQAASLSRQRKKEYMERLEHKVDQQRRESQYLQNQLSEYRDRCFNLEQENVILKKESQCWRERYYDLEKQKLKRSTNFLDKEEINKSKILKTTAASTTLLGIILILSFNFNFNPVLPFRNHLYSPSIFTNHARSENSGRIGRTLFSVALNNNIKNISLDNDQDSGSISNTSRSAVPIKENDLCNHTRSDMYHNSSESRRLTHALNSWGYRYRTQLYNNNHKNNKKQQNYQEYKKLFVLDHNKDDQHIKMSRSKYNNHKKSEPFLNTNKQLDVYKNRYGAHAYKYFDELIDNMGRNPDTLYFVSFAADNLVYPASGANKMNFTVPKITLLLPAFKKSDDKNSHELMKIDCEVRNFTVIDIKKYSP